MNNIKIVITITLTILIGVSCSTKKKLTREESLKAREEWLKFSQKEYKGFSKEQIISAAEEVLRLADEDDFKFSHNDDGFIAKRNWLIYAVLAAANGVDTWNFSVKTNEDGNQIATFYVMTMSGAIAGSMTGGGQGTTMTMPSHDDIVQGNAIYDMFWRRMNYVLDLSKVWPDCQSGKDKIKEGKLTGDLERICDSVTISDKLPKDLSNEELSRIFKKDEFKIRDYKQKNRISKE